MHTAAVHDLQALGVQCSAQAAVRTDGDESGGMDHGSEAAENVEVTADQVVVEHERRALGDAQAACRGPGEVDGCSLPKFEGITYIERSALGTARHRDVACGDGDVADLAFGFYENGADGPEGAGTGAIHHDVGLLEFGMALGTDRVVELSLQAEPVAAFIAGDIMTFGEDAVPDPGRVRRRG